MWSPCVRTGFRMVSSRPEFHPCFLTEVDTPSLQELVRPGWNGLIFKTSEELAGQLIVCPQPLIISSGSSHSCSLQSLLRGFPRSPTLETLKSTFVKPQDLPSPSSAHSFNSSTDAGQDAGSKWEWTSWSDNWNESIRPIVLGYYISQQ